MNKQDFILIATMFVIGMLLGAIASQLKGYELHMLRSIYSAANVTLTAGITFMFFAAVAFVACVIRENR